MKILVTGGAGYLGSHTCITLLEAGHEVVALDNLSNSCFESLRRVERITGRKVAFHRVDLLDLNGVRQTFAACRPDAVIHFAGKKAVGESVEKPLLYWRNNVEGTLNLLTVMKETGVRKLVFSSSATVYGTPESLPLAEDARLHAASPYGQTKLAIEQILRDLSASDPTWRISMLRYFNPVGAHQSGMIGEDPRGVPANLMPYVAQVAVGRFDKLLVFGDDWDTPDGTGVRDYIHVLDLAEGHAAALNFLAANTGCHAHNLGTGRGYSVLELREAFEKACGIPIPYEVIGRRPGDIGGCWSDPTKAERDFGWRAVRTLDDMCADAWRWQKQNPNGFAQGDNEA